MIRIYFDWNVFGNLKRESVEPYKSILKILNDHSGKLLIPYSSAHLSDLMRGYSHNEKAESKTQEDLSLIRKITKDHCLSLNAKDKVIPSITDPFAYFHDMVSDSSLENLDFENPFEDEEGRIKDIWKMLMDLLKNIPTGIDLKELEMNTSKFGTLFDGLKNVRSGNNIYNLLQDFLPYIKNIDNFTPVYKLMRNSSIDEMKINTDSRDWGNVFDYLDTVLLKFNTGKTFRQLIDDNLKVQFKDQITRYKQFTSYFITLDTFGYFRDKKVPNLMDDCSHAFYGAHCDIFITDDNNTYHKTKAVYKNFNISTIVGKASDFANIFYTFQGYGDNSNVKIVDHITEVIGTSLILLDSFDDELNRAIVYKVRYPIVNHFDRMQLTFYSNSKSLFFYKHVGNYATNMFWSEFKSVVDKIVLDLGVDDNLKLYFDCEKEKEGINNERWLVRIWTRKYATFQIEFFSNSIGLAFRITFQSWEETNI